jgi:hypothetical protein
MNFNYMDYETSNKTEIILSILRRKGCGGWRSWYTMPEFTWTVGERPRNILIRIASMPTKTLITFLLSTSLERYCCGMRHVTAFLFEAQRFCEIRLADSLLDMACTRAIDVPSYVSGKFIPSRSRLSIFRPTVNQDFGH